MTGLSIREGGARDPAAAPARSLGFGLRRPGLRTIVAVGDQGVSSATTFLTTVLVGRGTTREEFGGYILALTVIAWLTSLQAAFVTSPYLYRHAALPEPARRRLAGSTLLHHLGLAALGTALAGAAATVAGAAGADRVAAVAWGLAVSLAPTLLKEYGRQLSFAHGRPEDALGIDVTCFALQIGGLAWLALGGATSPFAALVVIGLASGISAVGWLTRRDRIGGADPRAAPKDLRQNWALGRWLVAGFLVNTLARDGYGWILTGFHGTGAAAVLAACQGLVLLASPIAVGIGNHLGPSYAATLAGEGPERLRARVVAGTRVAAVAVAAFLLAVLAGGEWGVAQLFGPQYRGTGRTVVILAASLGATMLTLPLGVGLLASRRADLTFIAAGSGAVATLLIGIPASRAWGPTGAAIGLLAATGVEGLAKVALARGTVFSRARPS